jgi:hypothetical protein
MTGELARLTLSLRFKATSGPGNWAFCLWSGNWIDLDDLPGVNYSWLMDVSRWFTWDVYSPIHMVIRGFDPSPYGKKHISLTWNVGPAMGMIPLYINHHSRVRLQWGHYNLPRQISFTKFCASFLSIKQFGKMISETVISAQFAKYIWIMVDDFLQHHVHSMVACDRDRALTESSVTLSFGFFRLHSSRPT